MSNVFENAIKILPSFFDNQIDSDGAGIFDTVKKIIDFDDAYICFLDSDSFTLKYVFGDPTLLSPKDVFEISGELKTELFSVENSCFDSKKPLVGLLNLESYQSFLVSKLVIQNTVFGFMLLCKTDTDFFSEAHIEVSKVLGTVISYKIKDIELSEVFNMQIKALAQSVVETKKANEKIIQADEVKTEFLANISHELRTPLNAIIGFSEMLSTQFFGPLNEKQADYVNDINVSGIHLLGMINEILDISKIEAKAMTLNISEFQISQAIDEVVNIVKPLADKKKIVIEKEISDVEIAADFQKIRQILYNLLSNAIKFSHENAKIYVNVKFGENDFVIEVKDNGIGIDEKDQARIFEKFVQLENPYTKKESSTGLGLTITKELVEMHKGRISVVSSVNKGATFIVKIPLK